MFSSVMKPSAYVVLGLTINSTQLEIRRAYRKLARKYHPDTKDDKFTQAEAEDKFNEENEAYNLINTEEKKNQYDSFYLAEAINLAPHIFCKFKLNNINRFDKSDNVISKKRISAIEQKLDYAVEALVKLQFPLNGPEGHWGNYLHLAIKFKYLFAVKLLIENGISITDKDSDDLTPIEVAEQVNDQSISNFINEHFKNNTVQSSQNDFVAQHSLFARQVEKQRLLQKVVRKQIALRGAKIQEEEDMKLALEGVSKLVETVPELSSCKIETNLYGQGICLVGERDYLESTVKPFWDKYKIKVKLIGNPTTGRFFFKIEAENFELINLVNNYFNPSFSLTKRW